MRVAPFKAQNMALNSVVTPDGAEIGRAQAVQAAAAGLEPEAAMNPILIKPSGHRHSQVIVMGRPYGDADARSYQALKHELRPVVAEALADLRERFDVVVCEGAGSPAEINLRDADLTNMWLAREADLPVIVVADIDRGGVFASLFGTLALLDAADQAHVAGFVINKFRGDAGILAPGLDQLEGRTGRPTLGVLPYVEDLWLDVEDSLALEGRRAEAPTTGDTLDVAVVRLRWMSNFTDVDALAAEPGVRVRFTTSPADVERADLVVVPGTKATVEDLERLRAGGVADALAARAAAGAPILGICGGYQTARRAHRRRGRVAPRRGRRPRAAAGADGLRARQGAAPPGGPVPAPRQRRGRLRDPPRPGRAPRRREPARRRRRRARRLRGRRRGRHLVARRAGARRLPPRAARARRRRARAGASSRDAPRSPPPAPRATTPSAT